jgi:hypothetical protein
VTRTVQPNAVELRLPAHLSELADDEEFREELLEIARTARARIRSGPNPLAGLTPEDIRRARECPLPEIIGIPPRQAPRGGRQG